MNKRSLLFLLAFLNLLACSFHQAPVKTKYLSVKTVTAPGENKYVKFIKNEAALSFTTQRPSKKDSSILLCIPAAFTTLKNDKVDGLYAVDGKIYHEKKINSHLGGGILIRKKTVDIFPFHEAKAYSDSIQDIIRENDASFFQQIQIIVDGKAEKFRDNSLFQRRAISKMKDGEVVIWESEKALTLREFAEDLVSLGVFNAIYTDMGAWDEGWYRDPDTGEVITIGQNLSQTQRQSNWFYMKKPD